MHPFFTSLFVNPRLRNFQKEFLSIKRDLLKEDLVITFFHDELDPHSHLVLPFIAKIKEYGIKVQVKHICPPALSSWMMDHKFKDASLLAKLLNISLDREMLKRTSSEDHFNLAEKLGHYQGGMFHFEGEWFWGVDRIYLLEKRLKYLTDKNLSPIINFDYSKLDFQKADSLDFYFSFRSPYSFLAIYEIEKLKKHIKINYKPLLPMAMRGFKIPSSKKFYIFKDAARIAHDRGLAFGYMRDPLGKGVTNALSLFPHAKGLEFEYIKAIFEAIWVYGRDISKEEIILEIAKVVGLEKLDIDESNLEIMKNNKEELKKLGLWGVPSFKYGEFSTWGQDRIPLISHLISFL